MNASRSIARENAWRTRRSRNGDFVYEPKGSQPKPRLGVALLALRSVWYMLIAGTCFFVVTTSVGLTTKV